MLLIDGMHRLKLVVGICKTIDHYVVDVDLKMVCFWINKYRGIITQELLQGS